MMYRAASSLPGEPVNRPWRAGSARNCVWARKASADRAGEAACVVAGASSVGTPAGARPRSIDDTANTSESSQGNV